jgi:hypothetical protein
VFMLDLHPYLLHTGDQSVSNIVSTRPSLFGIKVII